MKCFKLLLISIVHLAIVAAMVYLIISTNDFIWGFFMFITLISLFITLNAELDRD